MGLKDKATNIQNANILDKSLKGDLESDSYLSQSPEESKFLDEIKKKGFADSLDLYKQGSTPLDHPLSHYLLPDDLLGSTLPTESDYSLNSRIESLINIIEVCKELALSENPEEIWQSLLFSILGQIGTREAAIFIKEENRFSLKASKGFIFPDDIQFSKRSGIDRIFQKNMGIHYAHKVLENIYGDELNLFRSLSVELFIPVLQYDTLFGFIIIGKAIGSSDYSIEDLLYLKILGEVIGSFNQTIRIIEEINLQREIWKKRDMIYHKFSYFQQQLQSSTDPQKALDIFESYLKETFFFQAYAFFVLNDNEEYSLVSQFGLSKDSFHDISFLPGSPLLYKIQQQHSWFSDNELLESPEISKHLKKEEIVIFKDTQLLPLFFHNNLYGIFVLFKTNPELTPDLMNYAQNMITTYFWYHLSHIYLKNIEKNMHISITDPLNGVKNLLQKEESLLEKSGNPYGILLINVINFNRLESLFGERYAKSTITKIKKFCKDEFKDIKIISDIFMDKFILLFKNTDKSTLWLYEKSLHKFISDYFPEEHKKPLLHNRIYARPEDKEKTLDQLLVY